MEPMQKKILTKKFQTTMIGALFEFEKNFGYLWGHNKDENDLTDNELDFLDRWDFTRNQILNNGNNQLRQALSELDKYDGNITYRYKFNSKKKDNI
jgi:hypothetical protein